MDFGPGTFAFGYLAGVLSTLSPCVLPLVPILVAAALAQHRFGPLALALGVAGSFAAVGIGLAALGGASNVASEALRPVAAVLMVGFASVLLVPALQDRFAAATARLGLADGLLARRSGTGWSGQLAIGLLLGVVWSPCVGPTLGAASAYAAQGREPGAIALLMLLFGLGAGTPLLLVGSLSRGWLARSRGRMLALGAGGRRLLGAALMLVGLLILTGRDKAVESWLLDVSPDWLTGVTTRF